MLTNDLNCPFLLWHLFPHGHTSPQQLTQVLSTLPLHVPLGLTNIRIFFIISNLVPGTSLPSRCSVTPLFWASGNISVMVLCHLGLPLRWFGERHVNKIKLYLWRRRNDRLLWDVIQHPHLSLPHRLEVIVILVNGTSAEGSPVMGGHGVLEVRWSCQFDSSSSSSSVSIKHNF